MSNGELRGVAVLAEIAAALTEHGHLLVCPRVEVGDGRVLLTVEARGGLDVMEFALALQRVVDVATVRAFAERYGIDPSQLEPVLARVSGEGGDAEPAAV